MQRQTGVYFLIEKNKVIYVGKTTDWPFRLKQHMLLGMIWETEKFIELPESELDKYERAYIRKYKPEENHYQYPEKRPNYNKKKSKTIAKTFYRYPNKRNMMFRILTEKSIIGVGKFKNTRVKHLLDCGKKLEIASMYYGLSHISFHSDVLNQIGISGNWLIEKPGTEKDKFYDFGREFYPNEVIQMKQSTDRKRIENSIHALSLAKKQTNMKWINRNYNMKK